MNKPNQLYLVTQEPKSRFRGAYVCRVMVVEAQSAAAAKRAMPDPISTREFQAAKAVQLEIGREYTL